MPLTLKFHGGARELVGTREASLSIALPSDEATVRAAIGDAYPEIKSHLARMRLALNDEFVLEGQVFNHGDTVDLMPPVAGGNELVRLAAIRDTPLSLDEVVNAVQDPSAGAIASFLGVVRNHHDGKRVTHLEYEAQHTLAEKEMRRVLQGVASEFAVRIAAVHRVGSLLVGDAAVVVAASSAHRAEAFQACCVAMDRIKETVPVWKKEWAEDGTANWVGFDTEPKR